MRTVSHKTAAPRRTASSPAAALCGVLVAFVPLAAGAAEPLPASLQARYKLLYNGIGVGHLHVTTSIEGASYALSGSGKVSALFGTMVWTGSSSVTGGLDGTNPAPRAYAFDWRNNRKTGAIKMSFVGRAATDVSVVPPPGPHPDHVALTEAHKVGVVDPVSALLALTRPDGRPPCDRRVGIFDGKQRYDIVLTPKRSIQLPPAAPGAPAETAAVCRAMYEPIAGHRANDATRTYAANRDVEVVMRRVPGSAMHVPYSVTVPTAWGTGSMVTERIDIVSPGGGRVALTR